MSRRRKSKAAKKSGREEARAALRAAVDEAAHVLPIQGPLAVFVHHNTLHSLAHLPFHEAVVRAHEEIETEPYPKESALREAHVRGRILDEDLDAVLKEYFGPARTESFGVISREEIAKLALVHPIDVESEAGLAWRIDERAQLEEMRRDVPPRVRTSFLARSERWLNEAAERRTLETFVGEPPVVPLARATEAWALAALWSACKEALPPRERTPEIRGARERSHRELLARVTGVDPASFVDPWLIRFCASFLDRGMADWPMPERERGIYACFHAMAQGAAFGRALSDVRRRIADQKARGVDAEGAVLEALAELGVPAESRVAYLERVLLVLPGWAGMVRRLEKHPEEAHAPCALMELLAVRMTLDLAACAYVARVELGFEGSLDGLPRFLASMSSRSAQPRPHALEAAFRLFGLCQLAGITAGELRATTPDERRAIVRVLDELDPITRRRLWLEAFERRYREELLHAIAETRGEREISRIDGPPRWQVSFCIDDREESIRRHLEEIAPEVETLGVAGFYGLAIDYRGMDHGEEVPLCPMGVTPGHAVHEVAHPDHAEQYESRRWRRSAIAHAHQWTGKGTRSLGWAALLTPILGLAAGLPLTVRLLFPRVAEQLRALAARTFLPAPVTELTETRTEEERSDAEVEEAKPRGFTREEQIERVANTLSQMGLTRDFAPLVVTLGHGSVSLNNPHESAHDCGACGGRHGAANARLFARLANRPDVRAGLRERGIDIPDGTIFVGGFHNTANDALPLFDLDRVPESHRAELAILREKLDAARTADAHERCRRFENVPLDISPRAALRHVEGRAGDLSQPRPEYGHATNASLIVGRRVLTRGLFLDRRPLLVSYDPTIDPEGAILERMLTALTPVGSGINLEYYFSYVDNERFGCGTKLPHNITAYLGVMEGAESDLRTGLPWEMVEIHEPMRLLTIVESTPEILLRIAERQPDAVGELVAGGWMQLVCVRPDDGRFFVFKPSSGTFEPWHPGSRELATVPDSMSYYRGRREFLPIVRVGAPREELRRAG